MDSGHSYDLVVVGSGIAGLFAALAAAPDARVLVISKGPIGASSSYLAQGGLAAATRSGDSPEFHAEDTLRAGRGLSRRSAVEALTEEAPARITDLIALGVSFDEEPGLEGGHSRPRIFSVDGAATGERIARVLAEAVLAEPLVEVSEDELAEELWVTGGRCVGLVTNRRAVTARAVLLATGAMKSQPLGIPGEELHGVWPATLFLKRVNLGENVTLTGDAIVVGGGSTAMDAARSAWRAGASNVRVLYRRTKQDMPAQHEEIRGAEHEGVVIDELVAPVEILGRRGAMIEVRCQRLEIVGKSDDGRSKVAPVPGSTFTIAARTLLVAVGEAPDPSILPEGSSIQFGEWGGLLTDPETLMTAQPGVFAAGDIATGPKSVIEGVAQGQRAAWAIDRHLRRQPAEHYVPLWRRALPPVPRVVELDLVTRSRAINELARVDGANRFTEVSLGLPTETARTKAQRCLRCDVVTSCQLVHVKRKVSV